MVFCRRRTLSLAFSLLKVVEEETVFKEEKAVLETGLEGEIGVLSRRGKAVVEDEEEKERDICRTIFLVTLKNGKNIVRKNFFFLTKE